MAVEPRQLNHCSNQAKGQTTWIRIAAGDEEGLFLFATESTPSRVSTQPPILGVPGTISWVVEQPEREANPSPQSSAKVKGVWSYTRTYTSAIRFHGVLLSLTQERLHIKPSPFC